MQVVCAIKKGISGIVSDYRSLLLIFRMAFCDGERNPLNTRFSKRREFEEKVAQKYDELKRGYRNSLSTDHEADEIESQMRYSDDFLKRKARVLCYDFSTDEDPVEKSISEAERLMANPLWFVKMVLISSAVILTAIIGTVELISYFIR